jgi:glucose dehydrogenase
MLNGEKLSETQPYPVAPPPFTSSNEQPWIIRMVTHDTTSLYKNNCASCHGDNLQGAPPTFPSLVDIDYGGPVVTASGLLFIAATNFDKKFRAFDELTGRLLWQTILPAAGNATPAIYELGGRQFIVIVCGGGKNGAASGSSIVAFALPDNSGAGN